MSTPVPSVIIFEGMIFAVEAIDRSASGGFCFVLHMYEQDDPQNQQQGSDVLLDLNAIDLLWEFAHRSEAKTETNSLASA